MATSLTLRVDAASEEEAIEKAKRDRMGRKADHFIVIKN